MNETDDNEMTRKTEGEGEQVIPFNPKRIRVINEDDRNDGSNVNSGVIRNLNDCEVQFKSNFGISNPFISQITKFRLAEKTTNDSLCNRINSIAVDQSKVSPLKPFGDGPSFLSKSVKKIINQQNVYRPGQIVGKDQLKSEYLWINIRQKKNPVVKKLNQVRYCFTEGIVPDFQFSSEGCASYLSLAYHQRHPDYIEMRINEIPNNFKLRVLLVYVDLEQPEPVLLDLNILALSLKVTLILAFTVEEVAEYLTAYKKNTNYSIEHLKERSKSEYLDQLIYCLTAIRTISSKNVLNLIDKFGSMKAILGISSDYNFVVPGVGSKKKQRLIEVFSQSIVPSISSLSNQNLF